MADVHTIEQQKYGSHSCQKHEARKYYAQIFFVFFAGYFKFFFKI